MSILYGEKQFQLLVDNSLVGNFITDLEGNITYANGALIRMFGYDSMEELVSINNVKRYRFPEKRAELLETLTRYGRVDRYEIDLVNKFGEISTVLMSAFIDEGQVYGVVVDITDRKTNEKLLSQTLKQYESLFLNANVGIAVHELIYDTHGSPIDYRLTDVNPAYTQILGLEKSEVLGNTAREIYKTNNAPYLDIYSVVTEDGEPTSFETWFEPMQKYFRIVAYRHQESSFVTIFDDITESKQTEEELYESEKRLDTLIEEANQGILLYDHHGKFHLVNSKGCEILGFTEEELLNTKATDIDANFTPGKEHEIVGKELPLTLQREHRKKDGSMITVEVHLSNITHKRKQMVLALVSDITNRIRAELEKEKLIKELQSALAEVKTLSGMLPICANCKNIRDDKGYWNQIESYISQHSNVDFSHGICPQCVETLYGNQKWYQKSNERKE